MSSFFSTFATQKCWKAFISSGVTTGLFLGLDSCHNGGGTPAEPPPSAPSTPPPLPGDESRARWEAPAVAAARAACCAGSLGGCIGDASTPFSQAERANTTRSFSAPCLSMDCYQTITVLFRGGGGDTGEAETTERGAES